MYNKVHCFNSISCTSHQYTAYMYTCIAITKVHAGQDNCVAFCMTDFTHVVSDNYFMPDSNTYFSLRLFFNTATHCLI